MTAGTCVNAREARPTMRASRGRTIRVPRLPGQATPCRQGTGGSEGVGRGFVIN
jgi:hypothetical protein